MIRIRTIIAVILLGVFTAAVAMASGVAVLPGEGGQPGDLSRLVFMLLYASVALIFSFLCSVAEAVVFCISPSYIENLDREGRKSAGLLKKITSDIDRSLAAILTLNTIAHTLGAGGAGAEAAAFFGNAYVGVTMAVLTLLILFLSEIIPKTLGALYWRRLAPAVGRFVQLLIWVLYPLIFVSELLTNLLTRGKTVHPFSRDEFTALAEIGAESGQLDPKESRILRNLFLFPSLRAEDIMTPRTVVSVLQQDLTAHEVMLSTADVGFSRIPIYGKNHDDVTGFVLKTDILLDEHRNGGTATLRELGREIRAVKGDTPLSLVFEEMLDNRAHILLVVDDYGGTEGIVTLEDVVETLIGFEIVDEVDRIDDMRKLARQKWQDRMQRLGIDVRQAEEDSDEGETPAS